jgi:hypothetical protein
MDRYYRPISEIGSKSFSELRRPRPPRRRLLVLPAVLRPIKPEEAIIEINGVCLRGVLCYKCKAKIYPPDQLDGHIKRHDMNRPIVLKDVTGNARLAKRWEAY